ncbi:MAG: hypothetical protein ACYCSR_01230, partial [Thiomonas sp.]
RNGSHRGNCALPESQRIHPPEVGSDMAALQHLDAHPAGYPYGEIRYGSALNLQPRSPSTHE